MPAGTLRAAGTIKVIEVKSRRKVPGAHRGLKRWLDSAKKLNQYHSGAHLKLVKGLRQVINRELLPGRLQEKWGGSA
jgi:hypothetical protein